MPRYVGIDLVSVAQIEHSLIGHGDRFLTRVYTPRERSESGGNVGRLAARFAAKEATMKALGRGDEGFGWRSIEVVDRGQGSNIRLTGGAAALAHRRGIRGLSLSMARQRHQAAAVVIADTGTPAGSGAAR
jgi:holo-[acyl-carrier protein] synthase